MKLLNRLSTPLDVMTSSSLARIEELQIAIAARLKKVCYDWPRDRFDTMVRNLAFITVKYERQGDFTDLSPGV
jgi:hypothetical protein